MKKINRKQWSMLEGFYIALWCQYHHGVKTDFSYWKEALDSLGVSWEIQNNVACAAEKRDNMSYYFSTVMTRLGIITHES